MKMWAIVAILLLGMSLLPSCREKSQMSSRAVVTAIGIDADGEGGCALSVQAVEALKTAGSLSQQEGNATKVYTGGGRRCLPRSARLSPHSDGAPISCITRRS